MRARARCCVRSFAVGGDTAILQLSIQVALIRTHAGAMASARAAAVLEAALERQREAAETQRTVAVRLLQEVEEAQQEAVVAAAAGSGGCPDCAAARAHASHLEVKV